MRGIGESFSPDPCTGTGNYQIPIVVPAGRNGLQPDLALSYSTGNPGGSPFGFGWHVGIPGIRRKTSLTVPSYDGSDVFVLSAADDLVPVPGGTGGQRYRPRVEGLYARITHYHTDGQDYWEVRNGKGLVSRYGTRRPVDPPDGWRDPATIHDPARPDHVFGWLLSHTEDPFGNTLTYTYARDGNQLYPSEISYVDGLVRIVFMYEDREDAATDRRPGFPIVTRRRCTTIQTWIHDGPEPVLSRGLELSYVEAAGNRASLLARVSVVGHDGDQSQTLPPADFRYTAFEPERRRLRVLSAQDGQLPSTSLAAPGCDLVDLFGNGLPCFLQWDGAARYWTNLGDGNLAAPRELRAIPDGISLSDPGVQIVDVDGDGRPDLLTPAGYYPFDHAAGLSPLVRYASAPGVDLRGPGVRLLDVDGDGVIDAVRTSGPVEVYHNDRERGWRRGGRLRGADFPDLDLTDARVRVADMTGDGLTDLVLVADRRVTYWPGLGHARWGEPVPMSGAPAFPDAGGYGATRYDPRRLLVGDLDGDGCADLAYVAEGYVLLWLNRRGLGFAPPVRINGTPSVSDADGVRLVDLLGTGTAGILWTADAGTGSSPRHRFLDLTGGVKPYLLAQVDNNMGAVTSIEYDSSTAHWRADHERRLPWRTTLPFPVQVVARQTVWDLFSGSTLSTEYRYHHGHWDGAEREFRGFGRVDQFDVRSTSPEIATQTRTWFHLGPVGPERGDWTVLDLSDEYWGGDPGRLGDRGGDLPAGLPRRALRDAVRALRGRPLRTEVYAHDGDPDRAGRPYTVTENRDGVVAVLDGRAGDDPLWTVRPVFAVRTLSARSTRWERGDDPMHRFTWSGGYDDYGRPAWTAQAGVPRGHDSDRPTGGNDPFLMIATRTDYATRDDPQQYLTQRIAATTRLEVVDDGVRALPAMWTAVRDGSATTRVIGHEVVRFDGTPFEGLPVGQVGEHGLPARVLRLIHTPATLAAAHPTPPALLSDAPYPGEYPADLDPPPGLGYLRGSGADGLLDGWYAVASQRRFDGYGLVVADRDALGNETTVDYDDHHLLVTTTLGPTGLSTSASYDYRTMQVAEVTDANGIRTAYRYTPLGLLAAVAVLGRPGEEAGDTLEQPSTVNTYGLAAYADSGEPVWVHTTRRTEHRWQVVADERDRRVAAGEPPPTDAQIAAMFPADELDRFPERFTQTREYSDGFGRVLQRRTQAGPMLCADLGLPADPGQPARPALLYANPGGAAIHTVVSGWRLYTDKGMVRVAYEPTEQTGWDYVAPDLAELDRTLAKVTTGYDPLNRPVWTLSPDGSMTRTVFGVPPDLSTPERYRPTPWETYDYDHNDNAGRTHPATTTGWRAHWDTPASVLTDAFERTVARTERLDGRALITRTIYDARGNPITVTDPLGRTASTVAVDLVDRLWRTTMPDAGTCRMVLDPAGTVVEERDERGALVLTAVDALNRPVRRWARGHADEPIRLVETIEYGETATVPASAGANLRGRVRRVCDGAGEVRYDGYDLTGRPTRTTRRLPTLEAVAAGLPVGGGDWSGLGAPLDWSGGGPALDAGLEVLSRFDAQGRRTGLTCPTDVTGTRVSLTARYDPEGRVVGLSAGGVPVLRLAVFNARGERVLAQYGDAALVRGVHDPGTGRLLRQRAEPCRPAPTVGDRLSLSGSGAPYRDTGHAYDLVGNLLGTLDDGQQRRFTYDGLYRLTSATGREVDAPPATPPWELSARGTDLDAARGYTEGYRYDDVGNLIDLMHSGLPTRTFTTAPDGNRLASMTSGQLTVGYRYDEAGSLTGEGDDRRFEYDAFRRLVAFRRQAGTAEPSIYARHLYDLTGARVASLVRTQGGALRWRVRIAEFFERLVIRSTAGGVTGTHDAVHITDGTLRIARLRRGPAEPDDPLPELTLCLSDQLASVEHELDATGTVLTFEEYTPFGETSFGGYAAKRYRFAGKERDTETGWYHFGARFYAPYLARWSSCDPAGHVDGFSLYAYCRNRPTTLTDSTGSFVNGGPFPPGLVAPTPPVTLPPVTPAPVPVPLPGPTPPFWVLGPGTVAAAAFMVASLTILGFTIVRAYQGRATPVDQLDSVAGTHFGDIYGWVTGQYAKKSTVAPAKSPTRDDAAERRAFREWVTETIMEGCAGETHPLRKILDSKGEPYNARSRKSKQPTFDAGHEVSCHAGGRRFGMEDSSQNREKGFKDERIGVVFDQVFIDICGVPVEYNTAKRWEQAGLIPKGTVANAKRVSGWNPCTGEVEPWEPGEHTYDPPDDVKIELKPATPKQTVQPKKP